MDFHWTEERVTLLRKLFADGLTFGEIARELNCTSRNAVIGKAHRIGLRGRKNPATSTPETRARSRKESVRSRSKAVDVPRLVRRGFNLKIVEAPEPPKMPTENANSVPLSQRKQLLDLHYQDCRWPYGDPGTPDFFFCGAVRENPYKPYCPAHNQAAIGRIVVVSPEERARRANQSIQNYRMQKRGRG